MASVATSVAHHDLLPSMTSRTPPQSSHRLPYLPGLDGMRAIAVIAVLLYHAQVGWVPGGYLGVEVFFVISGFLITSLLLAEREQTGQIALGVFWTRRARRLLPALFTVLAVVAAYVSFVDASQIDRLRREIAGAFFYISNWQLIWSEQSYFETWNPSYLQHLWSLAVEEQFYVLWPLLVVGGLFLLRKRGFPWLVAGLALGSAVLAFALFTPGMDTSRIYYGTDTRAAGLLAGALLSIVWRSGKASALPPWSLIAMGVAGLGSLIAFFALTSDYGSFLYQGGLPLVGLATLGVIAAVVGHSPTNRLLGWAPLRWIGTRSYSIYLWHWPVIIATGGAAAAVRLGLPLLLIRVGLSIALAEITFRLVEDPIRRGYWQLRLRAPARRHLVPMLTLVAVAAFSTMGLLVVGEARLEAAPIGAAVVDVEPPVTTTSVGSTTTTLSGQVPESASEEMSMVVRTQIVAKPVPRTPAEMPTSIAPTTTTIPTATATFVPSVDATPTTTTMLASSATTLLGEPVETRPVLMVGDSVMVGAEDALVGAFGNRATIDAKVSRQWDDGIGLLSSLNAGGQTWDAVVIHLGTNASINDAQFELMMAQLFDVPQVIFLTTHVPRQWEGKVNAVISWGVNRHPNATLVDWHAMVKSNPAFVGPDGVHGSGPGRAAYASAVKSAAQLG